MKQQQPWDLSCPFPALSVSQKHMQREAMLVGKVKFIQLDLTQFSCSLWFANGNTYFRWGNSRSDKSPVHLTNFHPIRHKRFVHQQKRRWNRHENYGLPIAKGTTNFFRKIAKSVAFIRFANVARHVSLSTFNTCIKTKLPELPRNILLCKQQHL